MSYNLGTARGNITIEYDSRGVARARNDLGQFVSLSEVMGDSVDRDTSRADRGFKLLGASVLKTTAIILAAGAAANIMNGALLGVVAVAQSFVPIITASLATLPGILLGAAGAAVVLKMAMAGVGDAIKAAFAQDSAKFEQAIKKLAPEAQKTAKAFYAVGAAAKPLQQAVQNAFFAATAPLVQALIPAITSLTPMLTGVATGFNGILKSVLGFAGSPVFIDAVSKALQGVSNFLTLMAPGFTPLLNGFAQLAGQAGKFFGSFGDSAAQALTKFGEFLGKLDLGAMWDTAAAAIKNLVELFGSLSDIVGAVTRAFTGAGTGMDDLSNNAAPLINSLNVVVGKLAEFLNSAAGTQILNSLAMAMSSVASAGGDVLLSLLTALAPIFNELAPLIQSLARALGPILGAAFAALSPMLTAVANGLRTGLGPVLPRIVEAFTTLAPVIGQVAGIFGGVLGTALQVILPVIARLATVLSGVLVQGLTILIPYIEQWGQAFSEVAMSVLPQLLPLIDQLGPLLSELVPFVSLGAQAFLTLLVPAMRAVGFVMPVVINFLSNFISVLTTVAGWVGSLGRVISSVWSAISGATSGTWPTIGSIISSVMNAARAVVSAAVNGIKAVFSTLSSIAGQVGGYFRSMVSAVTGAIGSLLGVVRGIPGQVVGALGNMASLLYNSGRQIIQGLVNGIRSMIGAVSDAVSSAMSAARNLLPFSPAKEGPFSGRGWTLYSGRSMMTDLAKGLLQGRETVQRAMESTLAGLNTAVNVGFDTNAMAASQAYGTTGFGNTPVPATQTVPAAGPGITVNQTVNALPGQSAKSVGDSAVQRLVFGVVTGTSGLGPVEPGVA